MQINADFAKPVFAHTGAIDWKPSPMAGVDRKMLDRIGDEVARATSIVRYAKGSAFSEHTHSGGEEFIVLDGVFQDEHGDYPAGTYVRNPVGTHHVPRSDPGCTIFVKLWQFELEDQEQITLDLDALALVPDPKQPGISRAVLAERDYEQVSLEQWEAGQRVVMDAQGGFEVLLLDGSLGIEGETYSRSDWIRWPDGSRLEMTSGADGARIWIKRGHLKAIKVPEVTPAVT